MRQVRAAKFDAAYYDRFYRREATRVHGMAEVAKLGAFLTAQASFYGVALRQVLEVGAGVGLLRDWFRKAHPAARYVSTEYSAYAAQAYGHEPRDIATWRAKRRFDLVVCQGVLPYLGDREASAAIENLAAMSRGFLYLEAVTKHDYATACDRAKTDPAMHFRPASFYRSRLAKHFQPLGGGVYYAKTGRHVFWELETLG